MPYTKFKWFLLIFIFTLSQSYLFGQTEKNTSKSATQEAQLQAFETAEITQLFQILDRNERVKKYKALITEKNLNGNKVAILSQTALELTPEGFNVKVLSELLSFIKESRPKAVFFAGNLVSSFLMANDREENKEYLYVNLASNKNIFNHVVEKEAGYYNLEHFQKVLTNFVDFVQKHLGSDVAIYPVMGDQEAIGPQPTEIFREVFHLDKAEILPSNQLVYTVAIDNALYILLSTDYFDKTSGRTFVSTVSEDAWKWLKQVMENQAPNYDYVFIVAGDPVFSTTHTFGIQSGIESKGIDKKSFWDFLVKNKVRAYFSGQEITYDRSFKRGGWQIITGGGGAPRSYLSEENDTFYHFVLLNVPLSRGKNPTVLVYNNFAEKKDQFELTQTPPFLYQFRQSKD